MYWGMDMAAAAAMMAIKRWMQEEWQFEDKAGASRVCQVEPARRPEPAPGTTPLVARAGWLLWTAVGRRPVL